MRSSPSIRTQHGWLVLEAAFAVVLLGLLTLGVFSSMNTVRPVVVDSVNEVFLLRAQDTIYGHALTQFTFPQPEQASPSPLYPGFLQGWLPSAALGISPPQRIRYLVDETLTHPPATMYRPDPYNLVDGKIMAKPAINGLDFCLSLVQRERSGISLPGGFRMGFALQVVPPDSSSSGADAPMRLNATDLLSASANTVPATLTQGYGESLERLGCIERFTLLAREVKMAAALTDLSKQADLSMRLAQNSLETAKDELAVTRWQIVNWTELATTYTIAAAMAVIDMGQGVAGFVASSLSFANNVAAVIGCLIYVEDFIKSEKEGVETVHESVVALSDATTYAARMSALRDQSITKANRIQQAGLLP